MAPQHADQQGVHLGQHARLGPARQPPPQGRAAGLRRCRGQAAPGRALAQEAPQGPLTPGSSRRAGGRKRPPGAVADLDHGRNQAQNPDVQGCLSMSGPPDMGMGSWRRSIALQPTVIVKTASYVILLALLYKPLIN